MTKAERLVEIEAFWKSKDRRVKWEDISWEPYSREGAGEGVGAGFMSPDEAHRILRHYGYSFWTWSLEDIETSEFLDWEWALLDLLNIWYSMPEDWDVPLFINEKANAVCFAFFNEEDFALLFPQPASAQLGLEHARRAKEEWHASWKRSRTKCSDDEPASPNVSAQHALAYLTGK